jgi:dihydrofolate synthase/folylpolyglutamate synthase
VAVITNIALDHTEFAGPRLEDIAFEKVGISKPGSVLVVGDTNEELRKIWNTAESAAVLLRGNDFEISENELAVGGRMIDVRTERAVYKELPLPLHGQHQGDNASIALTAVEEFFGNVLDIEVVREGFAAVRMPGRFEVLGRAPLVVIDGAHNPAGADVCAQVFFDDFSPEGKRILVVGALKGRDPQMLLSALRADEFDAVICCTAPTPRGIGANDLASAAKQMGCEQVVVCETVESACDKALNIAREEDAVLVAGSLYVVGSARTFLRRKL